MSDSDLLNQDMLKARPRAVGLPEVLKELFAVPAAAPGRTALAYLLLIASAEGLAFLVAAAAGLVLYGLLLITLLTHAALAAGGERRAFYLTLALVPLIRLVGVLLPLPLFPTIYWYILTGTPLFIAAFLAARLGRLDLPKTHLTGRRLLVQIAIGITGIALGFVEYLLLRPDPMVANLSWEQVWLPACILLIFTGLLDETIFRGLIQTAAVNSLGRPGLLYTAGLYALLHLGCRSGLGLFFVFAVALFYGWAAYRTRSILGVTLSHGLLNIGLFLVYPFLF